MAATIRPTPIDDNSTVLFRSTTHRGTLLEMIYTPELGISCYMDHVIQSSEYDEKDYHEALVQYIMKITNPHFVCILGGGEGATAREVLSHKEVLNAKMIDWDLDVVTVFAKRFPQWGKNVWKDPRLRIYYDDVFAIYKENRKYDVVIVDLFEPTSDSNKEWAKLISGVVKWAALGIAIYCGTRTKGSNKVPKVVDDTVAILRQNDMLTEVYFKHIPSFAEFNPDAESYSEMGKLSSSNDRSYIQEEAVFIVGYIPELKPSYCPCLSCSRCAAVSDDMT